MAGRIYGVKNFTLFETLNIAGKNFKASSANGSIETTPEMKATVHEEEGVARLEIFYKGVLKIVYQFGPVEPLDYTAFNYEASAKKTPIALSSNAHAGPIVAQVETPHQKVQNPPTHRTVRQ